MAKEGFPTVKKYSPIWVPIVVFVIVSVDIINNTYHREIIENIAPSYVDFVRQYHGFDGEDLKEKNRIRRTIAAQSEPLSVVVELTSGATHVEVLVDGRQPYSELYQSLKNKYSAEGNIRQIMFSDNNVNSSGEGSEHLHVEQQHATLQKRRERTDIVSMSGHPLQRTLWNDETATTPLSSSNKVKLNRNHQFSRDMMFDAYDDITSLYLSHWKTYKKIENCHRLIIKECHIPNNAQHDSTDTTNNKTTNTHNDRIHRMMKINDAKMNIRSLQVRINQLKQERQQGMRDMDDIEMDIRAAQKEIIQLQRTHLNWFYYF